MTTAKLFMHGRSQAVRLPRQFRMPGTEVRVIQIGNRVILEPLQQKLMPTPWAAMDGLCADIFMPNGREQPAMPEDYVEVFQP